MCKSILKRVLSLMLTLLIVVSIATVGMVASSAATLSKPTVYVRDASGLGYALWAWTAEDNNLFSAGWNARPTSDSATADENGWKAYASDIAIGQNKQYSMKITQTSDRTNSKSLVEFVAFGDLWIDISAKGKVSYYEYNPDDATVKTKATAYKEALWVDTQADEITDETDTTALVKWLERSSGTYRLYLPSGLDITAVPVYHSYENLSIDGVAITPGDTVQFADGQEYAISGDVTGTLKVYQSANVHTMYMTGQSSLPIETSSAIVSKDDVERKGGNIYTADATGAIAIQDTISKIKGRGNSSWEASQRIYGKYAYNLTTDTKTKALVGGDVKTKKYSMLANNMDESMMRNLFIYSLADAIGLDYTPTIRIYDVYDNGNYHGTYAVCEKVEVGSSGLLSGITSLDDDNADVNPEIEDAEQKNNGKSSSSAGFYKYVDSPDPADITGGYLLEFELSERFDNEISGFVSSKGQPVVVKYPEYATKNEVLYIMDLFNKAEAAVYASDADINEISKYIDVESFAKMYLIQEMSKNLDAAQTSFYIYKESDLTGDGRLHASPVWDYDWTCGQFEDTRPVTQGDSNLRTTTGWTTRYRRIDNNSSKDNNLQAKLCACPEYWDVVQGVWYTNFADTAFSYVFDDNTDTLEGSTAKISEFYAMMKESIKMNESRWGFISKDLTLEWRSYDTGDTPADVVNYLNDWLFDRLTWLDANIGTEPTPQAPQLTVTVLDAKGELAQEGTLEAPVVVNSDVTINAEAVSDFATDIALTVNGEKVKVDADGNYTVALTEGEATEITFTVTAKNVNTVSTSPDGIATFTATYYVVKEEPTLIYGDADLDGSVSIFDATKIQQYCAYIIKFNEAQLKCADVNASGSATIMDVTHIQRYLAELSCNPLVGTVVE
ncbi:MAG: hypothetical protein E7513_07540 [Ruminococcaceae bacterium]|nr:hypothetical protein [Oscillospiraceae bacterium]